MSKPNLKEVFGLGQVQEFLVETVLFQEKLGADLAPFNGMACTFFEMVRRAGKSTLSAVLAVVIALTKPGSRVVVISPSEIMKRRAFDQIKAFLEAIRVQRAFGPYLIQDDEDFLNIRIGSEISAIGCMVSRLTTTRGVFATHLICDELPSMPLEFFVDALLPIIRPPVRFYALYTPQEFSWLDDILREFHERRTVSILRLPDESENWPGRYDLCLN